MTFYALAGGFLDQEWSALRRSKRDELNQTA